MPLFVGLVVAFCLISAIPVVGAAVIFAGIIFLLVSAIREG